MKPCLLAFLCVGIFIQIAGHAAEPLKIDVVAKVRVDHREFAEFQSRCLISLKFSSNAMIRTDYISAIHVHEAIDDTGYNMGTNFIESTIFKYPSRNTMSGNGLDQMITLKSPSRAAKCIKHLAGEAVFFTPSVGNGGTLIITNIPSKCGSPLEEASLKVNNLKIIPFTDTSYVTRAVAIQRRLKSGGLLDDPVDRAFEAAFGSRVNNGFSEPNVLRLLIEDPKAMLVNVQFFTAAGSEISIANETDNSKWRFYRLSEPISSNTMMKVYVAVPESIQTAVFEANDIPLP